jgi:organic hydroperoxide reductase OsmC/OhrA
VKPLPHHYHVEIEGGPAGPVTLRADGAPALPAAPPVEFDGPGDAWSPEHLLLASVEACFLLTLRAVAQASRLPFTAVTAAAEGTVDREEGKLRFTDIVLSARMVVPAGIDRERALRVLEKSERGCLVTASLATPVRLVAEVAEG